MIPSSEKSPLLVQSSNHRTGENSIRNNTENLGIANPTVVALAFTVFVQSYLLEGVFPYAGFLTLHLLSSENKENVAAYVNEETVGKYAGYVACSFMAGRTITAVFWGRLADTYGRLFVLEVSLVASAITSLGFGFASTYTGALVWRFLMGVGNGITGTIKCLLSEIKESAGSEAKETKTMAIVYGMRGYGFLLCPAITGFLSDPMKQYPQTMAKIPMWVQSLLLAYPFVLPNLLAFFLCWSAFQLVRGHVDETLPEERRRPFSLHAIPIADLCQRLRRRTVTNDADNEGSNKAQAKENVLPMAMHDKLETSKLDGDIKENAVQATSSSKKDLLWYSSENNNSCDTNEQLSPKRQIRGRWFHLYVYWIFSFLNIASDDLFPLFCLSKLSGLGLQEKQISSILGGTTIVYGMLQYCFLTGLVHKIGLYPTLRIGIFGSVPPSILIPIGSLWLVTMTNDSRGSIPGDAYKGNNGSESSHELTTLMTLYLCIGIAGIKSFSSVAFSTITMATNRTVDTIDQRAMLNGIGSLGGSFAKACGPVFAGTLFSFLAGNTTNDGHSMSPSDEPFLSDTAVFGSYAIQPPYGSIISYGIISAMGFLLGMQTLFLQGNTSSQS